MGPSTEVMGASKKIAQFSISDRGNECVQNTCKRKASTDAGIIRRSKGLKFPFVTICSPYTIKGARHLTKAQRILFVPYSDCTIDQMLEINLRNWLRLKIRRFVI